MRQCHRCGIHIPADGPTREIAQFSTSGARPTIYTHMTLSQCQSAQRAAGIPEREVVRR
ncbi:hypothetical protein ACFXHD_13795 [Streptomyces hydrogenans]|uniref:hypothetical protein n=1 Tax=Streptomyces hydrogenans TaxID=1873719 RepID=UPI0036C3F0DD